MKIYGLIGYPLDHSFSKQYFTEKFLREELNDCRFDLFPLASISEFPSLIDTIPDLNGLAVTIPYKESIISFLTRLDPSAQAVGAVNCIKISGKELTGYNTDITGFEFSFLPLLQAHHKKALILGTGGSSKAAQFVLNKLGIPFILVTRAELNKAGFLNYRQLDRHIIKEHTVIINCTPSGMKPNVEECPNIPYEYLTPEHYLFDMIYNPSRTAFLQKGERAGAVTKNGLDMLMLQAEENWHRWNEE
jgi:shikimate dehydrogenase